MASGCMAEHMAGLPVFEDRNMYFNDCHDTGHDDETRVIGFIGAFMLVK